jgi:hypothetical protein
MEMIEENSYPAWENLAYKRRGFSVYLDGDKEKFDQRRPAYLQQIEAIKRKLEVGVEIIKEGHRVARLNPTGTQLEISITDRQRTRLEWTLRVLQYRLENGHAQRWDWGLPDNLQVTNPNHKIKSPYEA